LLTLKLTVNTNKWSTVQLYRRLFSSFMSRVHTIF